MYIPSKHAKLILIKPGHMKPSPELQSLPAG